MADGDNVSSQYAYAGRRLAHSSSYEDGSRSLKEGEEVDMRCNETIWCICWKSSTQLYGIELSCISDSMQYFSDRETYLSFQSFVRIALA